MDRLQNSNMTYNQSEVLNENGGVKNFQLHAEVRGSLISSLFDKNIVPKFQIALY